MFPVAATSEEIVCLIEHLLLQELSRKTLRSYYGKAFKDKEDHDLHAGIYIGKAHQHMPLRTDVQTAAKASTQHLAKSRKREKGLTRAFDILTDRSRKR